MAQFNADNALHYAIAKVENKGIGSRMKNSSFFHSTRSALSGSGSAVSKGLSLGAAAGRAALKLIPIPIIGDLLGKVVSTAEKKARSAAHEKRLKAAQLAGASGIADVVKFELKDLSVAELDRYRWKLHHALTEANAALNVYQAKRDPAAAAGKACDPLVEMAMTVAQAKRRYRKLNLNIIEIEEVLSRAKAWAGACNDAIGFAQNQFNAEHANKVLHDSQSADAAHMHANCGDYCYFNSRKAADNWAVTRDRLARLARELSEPLSPEDFASFDGSSYEAS